MTENTNEAQHRLNQQDILNAWQRDTPVKTQDNRQVLDNLEAYEKDKLKIMQLLINRLGLTENSLLGAQLVTIAAVQPN